MNVSTELETSAEAVEVMQSSTRTFNVPPIFARAATMYGAVRNDHWLDTVVVQDLPSVTAIGVDDSRSPLLGDNSQICGVASISGGKCMTS